MPRRAIILLNMGGPDSLDAVQPFLYNLFADPDIIRLPRWLRFLQKPLARLIAYFRSKKVRGFYQLIGGKSPLKEISEAQAAALEKELRRRGQDWLVTVAMRYWHPFTGEAVERLKAAGVTQALALPLYPHYSVATTGSNLNELQRLLAKQAPEITLDLIRDYHAAPPYLGALATLVRETLHEWPAGERDQVVILFSAHGLPESYILNGDPYLDQIKATMAGVMQRLGDYRAELSFQSRAGPVKWLEPETPDTLKRLAGEGVRDVLVVPISFVSDHIETLYEIDLLFGGQAKEFGIEHFRRVPALNLAPEFIHALAEVVGEWERKQLPAG